MNEIDFKYNIGFMLYAHIYTINGTLNFDIDDSSGNIITTTVLSRGDYPEIIKELELMTGRTKLFTIFLKGLSEIERLK